MRALLFNTTLKSTPDESHTQLLLEAVGGLLSRQGVEVDHVHVRSAGLAYGVQPDMTAHGAAHDGWPVVWQKVVDADIVVIGTPLWLGEESSVCRLLIERLYAMSGELNARGQSIYYGKVAGSVITGNEDGVKHAAMTLHYALGHLGFTIPPQADAGWIGEAGPGPSYGDTRDDGSRVGFDNAFTQRNTTIMTWNLLHLARILRAADGYPNTGNDRRAWADGERFGFENPEYRS